MVRPGFCAPRRWVDRARRVRSGCPGRSGHAPAPGPHGAAACAWRRSAFSVARAGRPGPRAWRSARPGAWRRRPPGAGGVRAVVLAGVLVRTASRAGRVPWAEARCCISWCGAGLEPATAALTALCSNPLSYPYKTSRIRTGARVVAHLLYLSELSSSRSGIRRPGHTPRQRRAHRTGLGTRTAVVRPIVAPFCRRSPGGKSSGPSGPICSRSPSISARAEAPRHSALCAVVQIRRYLRPPARVLRGGKGIADSFPVRTPKTKRPRGGTRGRSRGLGRSG